MPGIVIGCWSSRQANANLNLCTVYKYRVTKLWKAFFLVKDDCADYRIWIREDLVHVARSYGTVQHLSTRQHKTCVGVLDV